MILYCFFPILLAKLKLTKMKNLSLFCSSTKIVRIILFVFVANVLAIGAYAQIQLTITPSNFNGYNIACFGGQNGSIDLTVTGGTPPYTYVWSNAATTQDISNLAASFYSVEVRDLNSVGVSAEITLTEPEVIKIGLTAQEYTVSGHIYNISLNSVIHLGHGPGHPREADTATLYVGAS